MTLAGGRSAGRLEIVAPEGVGEVVAGADLAGLLIAHAELRDGDIVSVTSKVVSKAEGRRREGTREEALPGETVRVVARRGDTTIVRNHLGLTMAAGGIDASNVEPGQVLLLPEDPDASARAIREAVLERTGANVGVLITDTAGRPWRDGQTDIAIGAAGLWVAEDFSGRVDGHGNPLLVTAPAVADELAGAAELSSGKLGGRPFAVIRGRADLVLPAGSHGTGARVLVRPDGGDMFGFGSREAVVAALARRDAAVFGSLAPAADLVIAITEVLAPATGTAVEAAGDMISAHLSAPYEDSLFALRTLAFAFGWTLETDPTEGTADGPSGIGLRFRPSSP
jgi:coenzyme F420-0:L-glutamate ligase/coenzyme F420-1:gamma-L-glutamate ligase